MALLGPWKSWRLLQRSSRVGLKPPRATKPLKPVAPVRLRSARGLVEPRKVGNLRGLPNVLHGAENTRTRDGRMLGISDYELVRYPVAGDPRCEGRS